MKLLLVLAFAVAACAAVSVLPKKSFKEDVMQYLMESEDDIELLADDNDVAISPQNIILRWQLNRFLKKFQKKMPCGFEEFGIPPLAPFRVTDKELNLAKGPLSTSTSVHHLRVDGLDKFKFTSFKFNFFTKRVKYELLFDEIKIAAPKYTTATILDELSTLGVMLKVEADDSFLFALKKLRLKGVIHYDTPLLWGSNKIKSMKTQVSIGKVISEFGGILGNGKLNEAANNFLASTIEATVGDNPDILSDSIENAVVPKVNKQLKGTDFWDILEFILNAVDGEKEDDPIIVKCVPPPDPWA